MAVRAPLRLISVPLALLLLLASLPAAPVDAIENKCSACIVIARELLQVLLEERPRNHLDMRNRLNSEGKREGKVIQYKMSELRVVETMDGLCRKMDKYSITIKDNKRVWRLGHKINQITDRLRLIAEEQGKELKRWCDRLLEEKEDEIADMIRGNEETYGDVPSILCENITRHCRGKQFNDETVRMADLGGPDSPNITSPPPGTDAGPSGESSGSSPHAGNDKATKEEAMEKPVEAESSGTEATSKAEL